MKKAILTSIAFAILTVILAYLEVLPGMTAEVLLKYYGLDYVGIFVMLIAQILLKDKNKSAFVFYIIGFLANCIFGYMVESYIIVLFSIYSIYLMAVNWVEWNKEEKRAK